MDRPQSHRSRPTSQARHDLLRVSFAVTKRHILKVLSMPMQRLTLMPGVLLLLALGYGFVVLPLQPVTINIGEIKDFNAEDEALRALSAQLRRHPRAKSVKLVFHLWSARHTSETGYIKFERVQGFIFHPGRIHDGTLCTRTAFVRENDLHQRAVMGQMPGVCF